MNQLTDSNPIGQNWRPAAMSFVVHILLVVFLFFLTFFSTSSPPEGELRRVGITLTVQTENEKTEYLDQSDLAEKSLEETQPQLIDPAAAPPPPLAAKLDPPPIPELPGPELVDSAITDANQLTNVPTKSNQKTQFELSQQQLDLIREDRKHFRQLVPKGDPTTISVFGSGGLTGRSFVFVLDRSSSMGSQGLGVIFAARRELAAAIDKLEPHHQFQIVGYNEKTVTMETNRLLSATPENKKAVPDYIGGLAAFGATNHINGLVAAVALRPDVIVLLTDGGSPDLNAGEIKQITRLAPKGCQIHCIQFQFGPQQKTVNFMTRLANQANGSFKHVDVSQWKQN